MEKADSTRSNVEALDKKYQAYIAGIRNKWLAENRPQLNNLYELMSERERAQVQNVIARWEKYITPIAEAWWKRHGFGVIWPATSSEPLKVFKLQAAA